MKRILLIVVTLVLSSSALGHSSGSDGKEQTLSRCSNTDMRGVWRIFHPNGDDVIDEMKPDSYLAIDYHREKSEIIFSALLVDSDWQVDGVPELAMDCDKSSPPNAVLSMPIRTKSAPIRTAVLCIEKVRLVAGLEGRKGQTTKNPNQIAIYPPDAGNCDSLHGRVLKDLPDSPNAGVTPGHSHADD